MNPHFFTALFTLLSFGSWSRFRGEVAHFVILSGEKGRVLKNGLSENMRTESKDLSAEKYKNSLPLEGKVPRRGG